MALALAESECLVFIAVLAGTLSWSFPFLAGREKKNIPGPTPSRNPMVHHTKGRHGKNENVGVT